VSTHIGNLTKNPNTELLVAIDSTSRINGAVIYFSDMKYYGSGTTATKEINTSGFWLLAVNPLSRGGRIRKQLTEVCLKKAKALKHDQVIIHSTKAKQIV
jgi:hypothetical protein